MKPLVLMMNGQMMTSFELFDVDSGNLVGSYAREEEARAIVRRAYESDGPDGTRGLVLLRVRGDDVLLIAEGNELVQDAIASQAASSATG